jgi:thiamine monophosphate kinase
LEFARSNGLSSDDLVIYGGEEYEIVATVDKRLLPKAKRAASAAGHNLRVIGRTTNRKGRIRLRATGGGFSDIPKKGWIHLTTSPPRSSLA